MRTILFFLIFFFFVGCSQNTLQTSTTNELVKTETVSQYKELDRIETEFKDELSPETNAMKQINSMTCPIK